MDENYKQYYEMINQQQQANNAWSAEQAQKAMDYQERMSNTAHQREVADLKAAGLNPVLSAGGTGATTGTGHAAQAGNENITALYGLLSKQIDAQIQQANAIKTAAKSYAGVAGWSNPFDSDDPNANDPSELEKALSDADPNKMLTVNNFLKMLENFGFPVEIIETIARKVLRLSKTDLETVKKYFGDENIHDLLAPAHDRNNRNGGSGWNSKAYEHYYSQVQHLYEGDDGVVNKKPGELDPRRAGEKNPLPPPVSKQKKREAATAVGLAVAAMIGKGLSGGSSKRIKSLVNAAMDKY